MTARVIPLEFLYQPAYGALPAVTLGYAWSSFMNTYAVWPENSNSVTITRQLLLPAGNYYVTGAVDNQGVVYVNDQTIPLYNFDVGITRTAVGNNTVVAHPGGYMNVTISAVNLGGPRGVAVTISEYIKPATGSPYVGGLVWNTRSATPAAGTYGVVSFPFRAQITAHVWGGGGGGGGMDAGTLGGIGAPGSYNTRTFNVNRGDLIEVFVGEGGAGGTSSSRSATGGASGSSRLDITPSDSFNGGTGGTAGGAGSSGGGGGGGGASGVWVNNAPVIVAGGGGGGGGAGVADRNTAEAYARRDANLTNYNNNLLGILDFRGENGQSKSGDGGGGGGGGGGYPGGQGGATPGGDISAFAGQCGGNFPFSFPTTGTTSPYYKSGFAAGGARGGGNGQAGRVFLLVQPLSLISIKVGGDWKQVPSGYVKVGGNWKNIDKIYVKVGNSWKLVSNSGQRDVTFSSNFLYGRSDRPYIA